MSKFVFDKHYNRFPSTNFTSISEAEFAKSIFFAYTPIEVENKQIIPSRSNIDNINSIPEYFLKQDLFPVKLFYYFDGTGIGMASDFWGGKVHYFRFSACNHSFKIIESRMCYRKETCSKCGFILETDSSD